ncbi:ras and ef-hand domain-containing protein [Anaeramoeba flamelloides]|uniref:Ras and ef-hand domain-containing protein n=1 Tax=Anaeramoeba flamelloides TaxID=1746091 RepID=A0AAV7Y4T7_9EUKA|nr:ras and ef-hand domain-containing protein [Anaeramoeba flamelloides]KAJ6234742.1 ras and ef-hand domain-containing protein [Anaeramoeba flamelloides]
MNFNNYDYLFKVLLIGESGVGKSSLMIRFTDEFFMDSHIATIGVDFKIKTVNVDDKLVKLQIWDTAGQDRFRSITRQYYRGTKGVILVYDVTNRDSFERIKDWMEEIDRYGEKNCCSIVIGNKSDLESKREVPKEIGQLFAEQHGLKFIETSAKMNKNVDEMFEQISKQMKETEIKNIANNIKNVVKVEKSIKIKKSSCC